MSRFPQQLPSSVEATFPLPLNNAINPFGLTSCRFCSSVFDHCGPSWSGNGFWGLKLFLTPCLCLLVSPSGNHLLTKPHLGTYSVAPSGFSQQLHSSKLSLPQCWTTILSCLYYYFFFGTKKYTLPSIPWPIRALKGINFFDLIQHAWNPGRIRTILAVICPSHGKACEPRCVEADCTNKPLVKKH